MIVPLGPRAGGSRSSRAAPLRVLGCGGGGGMNDHVMGVYVYRALHPSAQTPFSLPFKQNATHRHGLPQHAEDDPEGKIARLRLAKERLLEVVRHVDEGDLAPVCVCVLGCVCKDVCGQQTDTHVTEDARIDTQSVCVIHCR